MWWIIALCALCFVAGGLSLFVITALIRGEPVHKGIVK
jgi:hypothetical protein